MPGAKGKSGGQRDGSGRPVQKLTIRPGQQWVYRTDGSMGVLATVTEISRNRIVITLSDGQKIELIK